MNKINNKKDIHLFECYFLYHEISGTMIQKSGWNRVIYPWDINTYATPPSHP